MKTKIQSRHLWPPQLAFAQLIEAFSCRSFLFAIAAFGLLALPSTASEPNKAQRFQSRRVVAKKLAANNRGTLGPAAKAKPGATVTLPATVIPHVPSTVTNTDDNGPGSLRQALVDAQDGDTITFNISPTPLPNAPSIATIITLTSGELVVNKNITISGPGADMLTIARDANASPSRIFNISPGHTITIQGLTIANGEAAAGGGIYNDHSFLTVDSCALTGNVASGPTYGGGGIYNDGANSGNATLLVTHSLLRGNSAPNGFGGGIASGGFNGGSATLNVVDSTLSGNSASLGGGGAIDQNSGGSGGNAFLMIASSTLSDNSGAAGIYSVLSSVRIGNTILKAGSSGPNIFSSGGAATSAGYNLSNDDGGGFLTATGDQLNTDPMLGPLKDNGGPTLTYAPLVNSPAIDQGRRDAIPALTVVSDQRALARPVDDAFVPNHSGGDGSDIGAVELAAGVHPTSAASWKEHEGAGSFAINLPLAGLGIECRSGGANNDYQLIVTFAQPVTFSSAAVTSGVGMISNMSTSNGTGGVAGTQVTINLTGVANAQIITVALFDVDDGTRRGDLGVRMGVLVGDATDDGKVNASDISQMKFLSGQAIDENNVRADVIPSGAINASDISAAKIRSGTALP